MRAIEVRAAGQYAAELLIFGPIGAGDDYEEGTTAKQIAEQLKAFAGVSVLTVLVNSAGGSCWCGLGMFAAIQQHAAAQDRPSNGLRAFGRDVAVDGVR